VNGLTYTEAAPAPDLAHLVRCYWTIDGRVAPGERVSNRVLPDGCMDVIFNLADTPEDGIGQLPEAAYVVGTMPEAIIVSLTGRVEMVGVRFQPGAAVSWLGVPAPELTGEAVGLSMLRREAVSLIDQVAEATGAAAYEPGGWPGAAARAVRARLHGRAAVLDRTLRRAASAMPDPIAAAAVALIERFRGTIGVSEIGRRLAISPRTLTRRFSAAVGITPKAACRVARMQAAATYIRANPRTSLAGVAVRAGYHDQAHLNRDFRSLARVTPAAYARETNGGIVQDEIVGHG
jgi:methylphosphotriester-DNA--protein-cysteine methyltransferase